MQVREAEGAERERGGGGTGGERVAAEVKRRQRRFFCLFLVLSVKQPESEREKGHGLV